MPGKKRFVKQYLFFYLLSLVAPLVMGVLIYLITYNLEYKRVESENLWKLNQLTEKLDQGLAEAERLSIQLLTNDDVISLISNPDLFSSDEIFGAASFLRSNSLISKALLNPAFHDYFIFETSREYVITQNMVSTLDNFHRFDYSPEGLDRREFIDLLQSIRISGFYPQYPIYVRGDPGKPYLPYFHVYRESRVSVRVVMVLLDPRKFPELYMSAPGGVESRSLDIWYRDVPVTHMTGDIVPPVTGLEAETGMEKDGDVYLSGLKAGSWYCLLSQPVDTVTRNIRYIPMLILIMILTIMAVSLIFLLFLAYRSSRPILVLLEKIRQEKELPDTGKDAFSSLDFFVDQLKGRNNQLEELISEQRTKLKTNFLTSLIYDTIPNPSQIPTLARHAGLKVSRDPFVTVLVQLKGSVTHLSNEWEESFPISLISLQNRIYSAFGSHVHVVQLSLDEICILANLKKNIRERERNLLLNILTNWVETEMQETYVLGVSQFHYNLESAARSFREARAALVYNWPGNDNMVNLYLKDSDSDRDDEVYFPREMDHVILNALRTGQSNEVKECLLRLRRENLELRKLEPFAQNILISRYKEILSSTRSTMEIENSRLAEKLNTLIREPEEHLSLFLSRTEECLLELCDYFYSDQTARELRIAEKIREYLESNFQNNQISLSLTAESLGLSSQYLTRLIKKYYGKTFRNYMEDLRMEYVRKLIIESSEPIHLLIEKCGYNSMNTFCKAFKRKYGYKASSLRE
ncbi:MAG: helix-turn-helix domain-containing protein [Spirochaetales bacterium]|nr:helix-turn-helix domain-containing protein [Spirochaetales bacterium]